MRGIDALQGIVVVMAAAQELLGAGLDGRESDV